jgi:hypothetical protein
LRWISLGGKATTQLWNVDHAGYLIKRECSNHIS